MPAATAPTLRWRPHALPPGLSVVLLEDAPVSIGGDAAHGQVVAGFRPVRVGVWYGPGEDLDRWRDGIASNPGATFGPESATTVCGVPARRIEATTPARPAIHVTYAGGGHGSEPNPGETFVAVAFRRGELPVIAFYVVETEKRAAHAGDEDHFFGSIICK